MRPLVAHSHLSRGELYTQIDQRDKARNELLTAIELYRSMDMAAALRQAEIALANITEALPSATQTT